MVIHPQKRISAACQVILTLGFIIVFLWACPQSPHAAETVIFEASFDLDPEGFVYMDDTFRGSNQPSYANGVHLTSGGFTGGGLEITLGGIDNADILNMSGGWEHNFSLSEASSITLSFRYNLTQASDYESDELSQVLVSIDGNLVGTSVAQIVGNGNGGGQESTGWQVYQTSLGILGPGQHSVTFGGFNNKKTLSNESTDVLLDDVRVTADDVSGNIFVNADFDSSSEGFAYSDDVFRDTNQPGYADGTFLASGGLQNGALQVTLGGIDNVNTLNMSGGWEDTFTLDSSTPVALSFHYNLIQAANYESDEISQMLASIDGVLVGQSPSDVVAQITGNGNGGGDQSTGWRLFQANLGTLSTGPHTLRIGGYNNKKTWNNEVTQALVDDVLVMQSDGNDPQSGAAAAVASLSFQRFQDNIETLASFGDRTQGSTSYNNAAAWVQGQLEGIGYVVERHPYTFQGQARDSLYVTKVGSVFPDRMYIVSAHLDGRGGGGAADDDGSGCSLVLEVARVLARQEFSSDTSVRMIFWNNEETGLNGSSAYASDRASLQGIENPSGSGQYPEPTWLGVIQHDMIMFDHGLPPQSSQSPNADIDVEYRASSVFANESLSLANALLGGNTTHSTTYPAQIGTNMSNTDSVPFQNLTAAVSVRENRRLAEIGNGSNPHWHQPTDVPTTYSIADYQLGFNTLQMTLGTVAELAGVKVLSSTP